MTCFLYLKCLLKEVEQWGIGENGPHSSPENKQMDGIKGLPDVFGRGAGL